MPPTASSIATVTCSTSDSSTCRPAARAAEATGPTTVLIPRGGIVEWDRPGAPGHNPEGLAAFNAALEAQDWGKAQVDWLDTHIGDQAFADHVLAAFDDWCTRSIVRAAP